MIDGTGAGMSRGWMERTQRMDRTVRTRGVGEEWLEAIPALSFDGCLVVKHGLVRTANVALVRLCGYEKEALTGRAWLELLAPGSRAAVEAGMRRDGAGEMECQLRRADGGATPVELRWVRLGLAAEELGVVVVRDVVGRRQAERGLDEAARRLEAVIENTPMVAVLGLGRDGRIQHWNAASTALYGYKADEAQGRRMQELVVPESGAVEFNRAIQGIWDNGVAARSQERQVRTKDGGVRWVYSTMFPVFAAGRVSEVFCMDVDVTDRRRSEEVLRDSAARYESLFEGVPLGLYRSTPEGRVLDANRALVSMLGYPDKAALVAGDVTKAYQNPEDRVRWKEILARDGVVRGFEVRWRRFDGKVIWVRETARALRDGQGRVLGYEGSVEDVTQWRQVEEAKQQLEAQLRQAQKMEAIGTLAGGIAHDFNNILGVIMCYSEIAREDVQHLPDTRDALENVLKASHRARNLVRQILTFSRQAGQERRPTSLQTVVKEALRLLRSTLPATIEILPEIQADAPMVMADPTQMHQVLMNLCGNAAHAMRGLVGKLEVRLRSVPGSPELGRNQPGLGEGTLVCLTVSDTGCGMDEVVLKRIFEPFFTTKAPGEGTGLGLSVVDGIVRECGGVVEVRSVVGRGTTFDLYFPTVRGVAADTHTEFVEVPRGHGERVLLVDDEEALCRVADRLLRRLGYEPVVRSDPQAALALFKEEAATFALVISDYAMPGLSGVDLLARVLEIRPDVPVVLATGFAAGWTQEMARSVGIRDLLAKPFDAAVLGQGIHRILHPGRSGGE